MMLNVLPHIPLFDDLAYEQADLLKPLFEQITVAPGATLIRQGEEAFYLYIIIRGDAAIHYKPYDGASLVLTRLHDGDVFGWSSVVNSRYYTSSIISETELEAVRIKSAELLALLKSHPKTGRVILDRLVHSVSPRWQNAHEQVEKIWNTH